MKTTHIAVLLAGTLALISCGPPKATIGAIISHNEDGSADDDSGAPDTYPGGIKMQAVDGATNASSIAAQPTTVSGAVHAVPGKPAIREQAIARSNNKVVSTFTVTNGGNFNFNVVLNLSNPNSTGHATLNLQVTAVVLDKDGHTLKDAQGKDLPAIYSGGFGVAPNAQGMQQVTPTGKPAEPVDAQGNYNKPLPGPPGGVPLPEGTYQLKLELTMIAAAPPGTDTAGVDSATLTISVP